MEGKQEGSALDQSDRERLEVALEKFNSLAEPVGVVPGQQPSQEYEGWTHFDIVLEPSLAQYLFDLGQGDLSEGVRMAAKLHRAVSKKDR